MNTYLSITIIVLIAILIVMYIAIENIKKKRSSGSKTYKNKFYYQAFLKYFVKNIPD